MKSVVWVVVGFLLLIPAATQAWGQDKDTEKLILIMDTEVTAQVQIGKSTQEVKGRMAVEADATAEEMEKGVLNVRRTNLILYNFDQSSLGGDQKNPTGPLAFFLNSSGNQFKYDSDSGMVSASLAGGTHYKTIDDLLGYDRSQKDELPHDFSSFTQSSSLSLEMDLGGKLPAINSEQTRYEGKVSASINVKALDAAKLPAMSIRVFFPVQPIFIVVWYPFWEAVRTLPIQPVSIHLLVTDLNPSGTSYVPLIVGARTEWRKAGITFEEREFVTIFSGSLKTYSDGEQGDMFAQYSSADAVEIFYAENFSPADLYGGGATWGSGTAEAKIITSDDNNNGVDLTHLAHELGHALTLSHPGTGYPNGTHPDRVDGSSGTLMCPSGYFRDNPARQSQDNADNANNPLLRLSVALISGATPDCSGNPSCGSCAEHMD